MQTLVRPSFDAYVIARGDALLRLAYLLCGDWHLAEDLVQEVLIKTHRRWSAIEADDPEAYVKRALVRTHVSWRRRRASSEIATATFADDPDAARFDDAHASRDELWALLATLPRAQRAVLVLRYFEDLDDHRIADVVGVSPSTVRVHAHRGLHALRETLARRAEEAPASKGLLDNVRQGAARAATRRRAVIAGGIAIVIAGLGLAVPLALRPDSSVPPVEPSVSPTPSASGSASTSPTPTPSTTSTLELVPTTLTAPGFPYAIGYLPPGLPPSSVDWFGNFNGTSNVTYLHFGDALTVGVSLDQSVWGNGPYGADVSQVTVMGQPATLATLPEMPGAWLRWQWDEQYFTASTDGTVSPDDLVRLANSLATGTTAGETGLTDEIVSVPVPAGFEFHEWRQDYACAADEDGIVGFCIALLTGDQNLPPAPDLMVDGDSVYLHRSSTTPPHALIGRKPDGRLVGIRLTGTFNYVGGIFYWGPITWTDDDLVAIYRGITFTS